jgi:hypothetical protein
LKAPVIPDNNAYNSDQSLESVEEGAQEDECSNSSESSFSSIESAKIREEAARKRNLSFANINRRGSIDS